MKKLMIVITICISFLLGACSTVAVNAEQTWPLKIWVQNENGSLGTCVVVDDDTGVNYVVVTARIPGESKSIAITPRLNADGTLYTSR